MARLPKRFGDVHPATCRIHLGGIKNCIPAINDYDLALNRMVLHEKNIWEQRAIDICHGLLERSIRVNLLDPTNPKRDLGYQVFGHLKLQKFDGSWLKLSRCLVNANFAKFTDNNVPSCLRSMKNALDEKRYESRSGDALYTRFVAVPISSDELAARARILPP